MKSAISNFFLNLGRSLMLPIAVLPVAGILLRIGQPDIYSLFISETTSASTAEFITTFFTFFGKAGGAVFDNLAIIFAIGVAVGFAKDNNGSAALAAFVGHVIFLSALSVVLPDVNMGVLSGILIGAVSGSLYNKYHTISLPTYLAFFGGRRFVPIITGFTSLFLAILAWLIWPPIESAIDALGYWMIEAGSTGQFIYGFINRMAIPFGLHHVVNTLVWFTFGDFVVIEEGVEVVKNGDLWRFFAGDPTAGGFMVGFFPILMFGLPGAALAMVMAAKPENRKATVGILASAALTAFLTGITEPLEFSFLFSAFPLYVVHAILTGLSFVVMNILEVRLGFTFSAGLFDYLLSYGLGSRGWVLIPVGLVFFFIYFILFYFGIKIFNLKTPGRLDEAAKASVPALGDTAEIKDGEDEHAIAYIEAIGGYDNINLIENCTTRLRIKIKDNSLVKEDVLQSLGAKGVLNKVKGSVQVVIGPEVELLADRLRNQFNSKA